MNPTAVPGTLHESYKFGRPVVELNPNSADQLKNTLDQERIFNWRSASRLHSSSSLNLLDSSMEFPAANDKEIQHRSSLNIKSGTLGGNCGMQGLEVGHQPGSWFLTYSHADNSPHLLATKPQSVSLQQLEEVKSKGDGSCRLFGISLISNPVATEPSIIHKSSVHRPQMILASDHLQDLGSDLLLQQLKQSKSAETRIGCEEQGMPFQASDHLPKILQSELQGSSTRRCVKV